MYAYNAFFLVQIYKVPEAIDNDKKKVKGERWKEKGER